MTPEQAIRREIIIEFLKYNTYNFGMEFTDENIDDMYTQLIEDGYNWDLETEFRQCGIETNIPCDYSRHYESKSVATQLTDGRWVGWTFWYGGGHHGYPEEIPWMEYAYFLECTEKEVTIIQRTFRKVEQDEQ